MHMAKTFQDRLLGLHRYPRLEAGSALCIVPCAAVHTFFLPYAIDVVFLDGQWRVLKTVRALRPFRVSYSPGAAMAVELGAGYCVAYPDYAARIRSALIQSYDGVDSIG
jgi:uncharacterized membrane protein (UPF0127 family)